MTDLAVQNRLSRQIQIIETLEGDNYHHHVKQFTDWLRSKDEELNKDTVIHYFQDLNETEYSAGTKRIKRQAVKKRLRQLSQFNELGSHLNSNLDQFLKDLDRETTTKAPKINDHHVDRERYLTKAEAMQVVASCRGPKQTMIIKFLWATGCRVSEMIGIRRGDCKQVGEVVNIRITGKGNKERWIKISAQLYEQIRSVFTGEQWLFETSNGKPYNRSYVSNTVAKVTERATGKRLRAHALRHSFATHRIKEGTPISYVSKYLGHANLSITADMYDHGAIDTGELVGDEI